jgi:hypothetical protein
MSKLPNRSVRELLPGGATLTALLLLVVTSGCFRGNSQPTHYEKDGISFTLPGRHAVAKDEYLDAQRRGRAIHLEGPHAAVFSILCLPANSPKSLEQFAASVAEERVARVKAKTSLGGVELVTATRGTSERSTATLQGSEHEGIRQRYSISVLDASVPHTTDFYMLQTPQHKVVLMTQVADDRLKSARDCWQTIFDSLRFDPRVTP